MQLKQNYFLPQIEALETRDLPAPMLSVRHPLPEHMPSQQAARSLPEVKKPIRSLIKRAALRFGPDDFARFQNALGAAWGRANNEGHNRQFRETCGSLLKLLDNKKAVICRDDREQLAYEVLYFIANPERVDQGYYPTCTATAYAAAAFAERPELIARLVLEAAKRASFASPVDGRQVPVTYTGLLSPYPGLPGDDPLQAPQDGERAFSIQLLNTVFLNDVGRSAYKFITVNKSAVSYPDQLLYVTDPTGQQPDHWITTTGQYVANFEGAYVSDFTLVGLSWCGDTTLYHDHYYGPYNGSKVFASAADLGQQLYNIITVQHQTVVLVVSGTEVAEYFRHLPGTESQQNHVISITMYDPSTGMAYLNNQWGAQYDGWVPIDTLYDVAVYNQPA